MRLIVELEPAAYEAAAAGRLRVVPGRLEAVEVHQAGGLLNFEARALVIEPMAAVVADQLGLPEGGPAIRVYVALKEE